MTTSTFPVKLIGGGPGAWDLITVRGARALAEAEVILTDHLGPTEQLEELVDTSSKIIVDVAKLPYGKSVAQEETNRLMVQYARAGKKVARLKGGDPYIFGRGFEELLYLESQGIECEVIPGISSVSAVPAAAGVPLTHRGVTHSFTVVSGHLPPGHPRSLVNWRDLAHLGGTIVIIMGARNVGQITSELIKGGLDPATPAAAVMEGTTQRQRHVVSTLEFIKNEEITSPAVIVIGKVANLR